jgi:DNA invertase Pin-like site-specific DNA recombinase
VTRIERDKLAQVLAELADGTAPSTIARTLGVGYTTVARILEHLQAQAQPTAVASAQPRPQTKSPPSIPAGAVSC